MRRKYIIISFVIITLVSIATGKIMEANKEVKMTFVGDILLSRGVGEKINVEGYEYPYKHVKNVFENKDVVFGNLECPIYDERDPVYKKPQIIFRADSSNAKALKDAGFNILNLANNHAMDQNSNGLMSTINLLDDMKIGHVGAGKNYEDARKPYYVTTKDTTIGFQKWTFTNLIKKYKWQKENVIFWLYHFTGAMSFNFIQVNIRENWRIKLWIVVQI